MTVPADVQSGFAALDELLRRVDAGEFYEDYDESLALLGRATSGFNTVYRWFSDNEINRQFLENLVYCITPNPRMFRWNAGLIEWADPASPDDWHVLPGQGDRS